MAASIGSLCSTAIKQISTISAFIDAVQQAPADVQALNNELASLNPCANEMPESWKKRF